jgi:16S rRNA (guanine527-N7)-methyltransferase
VNPGRAAEREPWRVRLHEGAAQILGRRLTAEEDARTERYLALLRKWQRIHRLIGSSDPAWIVDHLLLDSLLFSRAMPSGFSDVLDLGSGAGFPGIPLRIVREDVRMTLLEARVKRVSFLRAVVRELDLSGVTVLGARAESLGADYAGRFDTVVAKCAGPADRVLSVALPLVAPTGSVVLSSHSRDRGSRVRLGTAGGIDYRAVRTEVQGPGGLRSFLVVRPARHSLEA